MSNSKKMTKAEAGRLGGLATKEKYGSDYFKRLGEKGAQAFHSKYKLMPAMMNDFAIVDRQTGEIVAFTSGRHLPGSKGAPVRVESNDFPF